MARGSHIYEHQILMSNRRKHTKRALTRTPLVKKRFTWLSTTSVGLHILTLTDIWSHYGYRRRGGCICAHDSVARLYLQIQGRSFQRCCCNNSNAVIRKFLSLHTIHRKSNAIIIYDIIIIVLLLLHNSDSVSEWVYMIFVRYVPLTQIPHWNVITYTPIWI